MKIRILLALLVGLFVAADRVKGDASQDDQDAMQGAWTANSGEVQGQKMTADALRNITVVIKGKKMTFSGDRVSAFELDATKKPKVIAVTPLDGPRKGQTQRAIYAIEKGMLKLCLTNDPSRDGKQPPKEFATKPGDGMTLVTFKRDDAAGDKQ